MKDDVLSLLASPAPGINNQNNLLTPSLVSFASDSNFPNDYNHHLQQSNKTFTGNFDCKIRELEEQARQFKIQDANRKYKAVCFNTNENQSDSGLNLTTPRVNTSFTSLNVNTKSFSPNSMRIGDNRNEEIYLEKIKQKLEMQLKETENLKHEMSRTKPTYNENLNNSGTSVYRATFGHAQSMGSFSGNGSSNGMFDELIDLRSKLKESFAINEELKLTFRQNLTELQSTLSECVDDKEKLMAKKDDKIRDLEDECRLLRQDLGYYQKILDDNPSIEIFKIKMNNYEDLNCRLRQMLIAEEKKREKSYFVNGFSEHVESSNGNNELACKLIYKAILNCLEDYQGEIKHSRMIMKELQNSWETKETNLKERESILNSEFNRKCEKMKEEYERLFKSKTEELNSLKEKIEEMNEQFSKEREKSRKKFDAKDLEFKTANVSSENLKSELATCQKELKQLKTRFENAKTKEKENLANYQKTLDQLEKDNEKMTAKYEKATGEYEAVKKKIEIVKSQITKYEQLIDSLNEQIILYKRDVKENEINYNQTCKNFESEREANIKLGTKCQQLEKILQEHQQSLAKFQNLEKNYNDLQFKHKQLEVVLNSRLTELDSVKKDLEVSLSQKITQSSELALLKEKSLSMEVSLKASQTELEEMRVKFQNGTMFIQHSCKANALLKEEKDSLEKILKDNACKLKDLKGDYDKIYERYVMIENEYNNVNYENDLLNKKLAEIKKLNEIIESEKIEAGKEVVQYKSELNNLQATNKTLTRKLNSGLAEKDAKISQFEQTLALYEKEIQLLKQSESLQKSQENTKVIEVANTVQAKLAQKNSKIESLKAKLTSAETSHEQIIKEKIKLQGDKMRLEDEYKSVLSKNEVLVNETKKFEDEFNQLRQKISHYELTMEKAAIKLTESEKRNELLSDNLNKFKTLITAIVYSDERSKTPKPMDEVQNISDDSPPIIQNASNAFSESLATFVISKLKEHIKDNNIVITESNVEIFKDESIRKTQNESNEVNILNFFNGLQQKLQSTYNGEDEEEIAFNQNKGNKIQTSSANDLGRQNSSNKIVLDADQSSIAFNDISHESCQESNTELCNRIESKLSHLNQIGLNLKKENNEANNLLLSTG